MNENIQTIRYEASPKSQTFRMSELPEAHVVVRGVAYFADEDGFLALCDNPTSSVGKSDLGFLCENAYMCDWDAFGAFTPDVHIEYTKSIIAALVTLAAIDFKAIDEAI